MKKISLGSQGLKVSEIGYGCMGLTSFYGDKVPDSKIIDILKESYDLGVDMWDTANVYIYMDLWRILQFKWPIACQEEILAKALKKVGRENIILATKTGLDLQLIPSSIKPRGDPVFIRKQCEASLARLQTDYIDLFYLHRIDKNIPIEISMLEMKKLVQEGKVRYVGLSECSASTIRRAHKVHPLTAVQLEYSLWCRGIESDVLETCKELGIGLVAYSPLGRGFLTSSSIKEHPKSDLGSKDEKNLGGIVDRDTKLLLKVEEIAKKKGVKMPQLALAWVKAQQFRTGGAGVVAIPGTTKLENLKCNVESVHIELTEDELAALEEAVVDQVQESRSKLTANSWENDENPSLSEQEAEGLGIDLS